MFQKVIKQRTILYLTTILPTERIVSELSHGENLLRKAARQRKRMLVECSFCRPLVPAFIRAVAARTKA